MAYNRELLKTYQIQFEARRQYPYDDQTGKAPKLATGGKITIGVGWNLTDNGLPDDVIDFLHDRALENTEKALLMGISWVSTLDEVRYLVLMDMAFNMGVTKLLTFKRTLALIEGGKYREAAKAMLQSKWASQVGARATILALMMESGKVPVGV